MEFIHKVSKENEGKYYTVDFTVPEGVEKITVSYDYYRPTKGLLSDLKPTNCIDIGLADEKGRFLGWSGSSHPSVSVGEYSSTNGYLREKINPGEWKIIVGAYHVLPEGVEVKYTVDFQFKGEKLLFGDLHIHSDASDGRFDAFEIAKMARERGLDFAALANHNNYSVNFSLPQMNGFTFVPAVEWTHYKGHMNFFGVPAPFENSFIANSKEEMRGLLEQVRASGAVISVNHPKCRICPYLWEDDDVFDMVEIWNGPMRPTNTDGIEYWTGLLRQGRRIPAVGGSDYHSPKGFARLGNPVTGVYARSPSAQDILEGIRSGRSFVSCGRQGPVISLRYGDKRMGDEAQFFENVPIEAEITYDKPFSAYLVTEGGERKFTGKKVYPGKTKFAYVKIRGKYSGRVLAVSNPIYFR